MARCVTVLPEATLTDDAERFAGGQVIRHAANRLDDVAVAVKVDPQITEREQRRGRGGGRLGHHRLGSGAGRRAGRRSKRPS